MSESWIYLSRSRNYNTTPKMRDEAHLIWVGMFRWAAGI
jgi:hypothetical protein